MAIKLLNAPEIGEMTRAETRWADRLGSEKVGTQHTLLACCEMEDELGEILRRHGLLPDRVRDVIIEHLTEDERKRVVLDDALEAVGIDRDEVKTVVEASFGPGAASTDKWWSLTPWADRVSLGSEMIAERLGDEEVKPVHHVLASLWYPVSEASDVMTWLDIDVRSLRKDLVERFQADEVAGRLVLTQWEASERALDARNKALRFALRLDWVGVETIHEEAAALFARGGTLAIRGVDALEVFWNAGTEAGFALIDSAPKDEAHFWVAVNVERRQGVVLRALLNRQGELRSIGARAPSELPPWAMREPYWPILPIGVL